MVNYRLLLLYFTMGVIGQIAQLHNSQVGFWNTPVENIMEFVEKYNIVESIHKNQVPIKNNLNIVRATVLLRYLLCI
jgi:hypothetical protein